MDRLSVMSQFLAVAEAGSFSAAARRLNVGQPAVSKAIAQLEAHLGVRLFLRSTRKLTLTEAGLRYREGVVRALEAAAAAESLAKGDGGRLAGRVRVVIPTCLARLYIVPRLADFKERFPEVVLELQVTDLPTDVIATGADVALRIGSLADSALVASRIGRTRMALVARTSPDPISTPMAVMGRAAITSRVYHERNSWVFRDGTARIAIMVSPALVVDSDDVARAAALAGHGLAMLPRPFVAHEIARGELVELLPQYMLDDIDIWAVLPGGREQTARVRAFLDWLKRQLVEILNDDGGEVPATSAHDA